jgi:YVTN family beta-propeller protein
LRSSSSSYDDTGLPSIPGTVIRVDPLTGTAIGAPIPVGRGPLAVAASAEAIWVSNTLDGSVSRIDPVANLVTATIPVGDSPLGIAAGFGSVWVASVTSGKVARIDPPALLERAHDVAVTLEANPLRADIEGLARHARIELHGAEPGPGMRPASAPKGRLDTFGLTDRESEVIGLVAAGWTNQQIADALFITCKTDSVHVSNIMGTFGVRNRVEAAAIAHRLGMTSDWPG